MTDHAGRGRYDKFRRTAEKSGDVAARIARELHPRFTGEAVGASRIRDDRLQMPRLDAIRCNVNRRGFHAIRAEHCGCGGGTIGGNNAEVQRACLGLQPSADAGESKSAHGRGYELDFHLDAKPLCAELYAEFAAARDARHLPWQRLYFLPEPHGNGSLRPTLSASRLAGA